MSATDSVKGEKITAQISELRDRLDNLSKQTTKFDCKDYEFNGLRNYILIARTTAQVVEDQLKSNQLSAEATDALAVVKHISDLIESRAYQKLIDPIKVAECLLAITKEQFLSLLKFKSPWLPKEARKASLVVGSMLGFSQSWTMLFSRSKQLDLMASGLYAHHDPNQMTFLTSPWLNRLTSLVMSCDRVEMVTLKAQSLHKIEVDGSIVEKEPLNRSIECQLIRTGSSKEYDGTLYFDVHGGGFVSGKPPMLQIMLRQLARKMPGLTILTPDYRLSPEHKFPCALQDLLDCYLSVTGVIESNSEEILQFKPKKIVVVGGSSGGNSSLALCRALAKMGQPVPEFVLLQFPFTTTSLFDDMSISRISGVFDPMLSPASFCFFLDAYCPGDGGNHWYRSPDKEVINKRIDEINKMARSNDLFNPTLGGYEVFKSTKLLLLAGEFDPLLDDSVQLARQWPNQDIDFIVIPSIGHGPIGGISTDGKAVMAKVDEKIKEFCRSDN